jgi:GTP-binding protein
MLKLAFSMFDKQKNKIKTSDLNNWLAEINKTNILQSGSVRFKLKYITQVGILPLTFVIFVSNKDKIRTDHERFIINNLKTTFSMTDVIVRAFFKEQKKKSFPIRK